MYAREPLLAAFPRDAADVAAAIAVAGRFDVPVVTRGAGTSLAGQTIGGARDRARHLAPHGRDRRDRHRAPARARRPRRRPGGPQPRCPAARARLRAGHLDVQPGHDRRDDRQQLVGQSLDRLRLHDRPRARARGRARRRVAGDARPRRRRAGRTSAMACGRSCATTPRRSPPATRSTGASRAATGSTGSRRSSTSRSSSTGSEGTLVAITEATVGLVPLPSAKRFAVGHFDSLAAAIAATDDALELGAAAVELIDRTILELSRSKLEYRRLADTLEGDPAALLFVTFFGDEAQDKLERLEAAWRRHGHGYHTLRAETAAEQEALTKVRKAGLGLLMAASTGARRPLAFVEDTAVAPERLNDYVAAFKAILDRHGLEAGWYGHASVGCLHIRPFVDLTAPGGVDTMRTVAEEIADAGGRVRRRELVRARRRPRPQCVQPAHVRRRPVRGDAAREGAVRPARAAEPGRDGRRRADHRGSAGSRAAAARPARPPACRSPSTAGCAGRPTAASGSAPAARRARASCARPTWPRARRSTPPAAARTRSSRRCRSPTRARRSATSGCTRSSTSAWSARRARASAR